MASIHDSSVAAEETFYPQWKAWVDRIAKEAGASYALLFLRDDASSELRKVAGYGHHELPEGGGILMREVLRKGKPLFLHGKGEAREIQESNLRGRLIGFPVINNNITQGVLIISSPQTADKEPEHWLPLLESTADLVGITIHNLALKKELGHKEEEVRALIKDTLDAQESERERICLEVHDGVTQTMASVYQYLQTLETTSSEGTATRQLLIRASTLARQAIQESREIINSLQPTTLKDLGLVTTLQQEMRQLEQETHWEVDFKADRTRFPGDVETGLYRIIHEALANVKKHANTKRLRVWITTGDDRIRVEVRDWGVGFKPASPDIVKRKGIGLTSMHKRAELLHGSCNIWSTPGQGTTVTIEIPIGTYLKKDEQDKSTSG